MLKVPAFSGSFQWPAPATTSSKLMRGLVAAGHDVTMISCYPMKDVPKNGKYTDIVLDGFAERHFEMVFKMNLFEFQNQGILQVMYHMSYLTIRDTNDTFHHPKVRQLLASNQQFDAVIVEQFWNDALKVFAHIYSCPLIVLSSMGPNPWVNPTVGNPQPVSYVPHLLSGDFSRDLSIWNRATNMVAYLLEYLVTQFITLPANEKIMHQAFPNSPPLYDIYTNVLLNSHTSLYPALPTVPNIVEIGGLFIDPPKKLPDNIQKFLDSATDGAIYFSMGSNLKSKDIPPERRQILLNVLGKLKMKVLWKFEEDLPGRPANVMIRSWLPQQDILAHPNIKLFITHGGLLSTTETVYHGVPILALPVFGDQSSNADRAVYNGYGLKLHYNDPNFSEELLEKLILELLNNPKYRKNVQEKSKIFHDRSQKPMDTAVYWIEYVIRHKGAPHLRVAGVRLPWYKYFMLDVLGIAFFGLFAAVFALKSLLGRLCRRKGRPVASKKGKKVKKQ
uniref:UDP-glucuronosyltransferase n=2 Tax=Dendroctonus ponderosae TaxID=77166 RepID=A0AAR5NYV6_DENPD